MTTTTQARLARHSALAEDAPGLLRRSAAGELIVEVAEQGGGQWPERVASRSGWRPIGWRVGYSIGPILTHGPGRPNTTLCRIGRRLTEAELAELDDDDAPPWAILDEPSAEDWGDLYALRECRICGYNGIVTMTEEVLCRGCALEVAESTRRREEREWRAEAIRCRIRHDRWRAWAWAATDEEGNPASWSVAPSLAAAERAAEAESNGGLVARQRIREGDLESEFSWGDLGHGICHYWQGTPEEAIAVHGPFGD